MSVPQHIVEQLEDYLDGKLDHAGRELLMSWLNESEANGKALAAWFMTEVQLLEATRLADLRVVFEGMAFDPCADRNELRFDSKAPSVQKPQRISLSWLVLAATILAVLAGAELWRTQGQKKNQVASASGSNPAPSVGAQPEKTVQPSPAILGRLANCVWATGTQPIRVGQDIAAGTTIGIKSGLAQLIFESGAEVVLKGPCSFRVDNAMLGWLSSGNVSAEVPPRAAGFTIRGPSAEVIDLGTRFGFSVGAAGKSEVHVFQGEVISRQLDEHGQVFGNEIRLKKNQAILFPGERRQAQRLAADEAKFATEVQPLWRQDQIEPLIVDRNLVLWLRAAHGVQADRKHRVIAWQDLALGHNRISNDAFQSNNKARPQLVSQALGGRPAIRFDGSATYLTTTPITTTDNQTIVAVFQHAPPDGEGEQIGGQILNYNGPPSRYLPDVQSPGVLQLGEKIDSWNGPAWSIAAKVFVGRDSRNADVSAGVVVSEPLGHSRPRVVAYVYDNTGNSAALFVDGKRVAEASAPTRVAVTSRKVIGKHGIFDQWYFRGDLGEVVIFNSALTPLEIEALSHQLMRYYHFGPNDWVNL